MRVLSADVTPEESVKLQQSTGLGAEGQRRARLTESRREQLLGSTSTSRLLADPTSARARAEFH